MEPLQTEGNEEHPADLTALSDVELSEEIRRLTQREREISFQRRYLHGQIEIARSELIRRLAEAGTGALNPDDLEELNRILSGEKGAP
jgi:hypothetical protein